MKEIITYKKKLYYNTFFVKIARIAVPLILYSFKVKIAKVQGTIPKKGPLLIAAHHEDAVDQFVVGLPIKRRLFWIADITPPNSKRSFADAKFKKWLLIRLGAVPIDKHHKKRNINLFNHLLHLLEKGEAIVFFPESYLRSERKQRFGKFRDGVVRLALEYQKTFKKQLPIYPAGLKYKKQGSIKLAELNIGKPITVKKRADRTNLFSKIRQLS